MILSTGPAIISDTGVQLVIQSFVIPISFFFFRHTK
jgi:hypothetical protein